jgi:hypothetical protein
VCTAEADYTLLYTVENGGNCPPGMQHACDVTQEDG